MERITIKTIRAYAQHIAKQIGTAVFVDQGSRMYGNAWEFGIGKDTGRVIIRASNARDLYNGMRAFVEGYYFCEGQKKK